MGKQAMTRKGWRSQGRWFKPVDFTAFRRIFFVRKERARKAPWINPQTT